MIMNHNYYHYPLLPMFEYALRNLCFVLGSGEWGVPFQAEFEQLLRIQLCSSCSHECQKWEIIGMEGRRHWLISP